MSLNRIIKLVLISYITLVSLGLIAYVACFFIDKFASHMMSSVTNVGDGYIIKIGSFSLNFPVLFGYLDLLIGGFFIPQILIVASALIYLRFMNGKYNHSLSIEKLKFIKKLILIAYILGCIMVTTDKWTFSFTENLWLVLVLFILEKDIFIVKKNLKEITEIEEVSA